MLSAHMIHTYIHTHTLFKWNRLAFLYRFNSILSQGVNCFCSPEQFGPPKQVLKMVFNAFWHRSMIYFYNKCISNG